MALLKTRKAIEEEPVGQNESDSDVSVEEEGSVVSSDAEEEEDEDDGLSPKRARNDEDVDSGSADESGSSDEEKPAIGNAGWADAISKVLRTNKPKKKKTLVLSRAKKLNEVVVKDEPENLGFEIDGEEKIQIEEPIEETDEKPDVKPVLSAAQIREQKKKRKLWDNMSRSKPNVLAKEREKSLSKIATRGVVQLFNAVRQQQKDIETGLDEAGVSERKREKVLKSVDKNSFLDILMGPSKSVHIGRNLPQKDEPKDENGDEKAPIWSVLRDDFMMGDGKLKDWDKQQDSESDDDSAGESISDGESDGS